MQITKKIRIMNWIWHFRFLFKFFYVLRGWLLCSWYTIALMSYLSSMNSLGSKKAISHIKLHCLVTGCAHQSFWVTDICLVCFGLGGTSDRSLKLFLAPSHDWSEATLCYCDFLLLSGMRKSLTECHNKNLILYTYLYKGPHGYPHLPAEHDIIIWNDH